MIPQQQLAQVGVKCVKNSLMGIDDFSSFNKSKRRLSQDFPPEKIKIIPKQQLYLFN
jgi:hypothetical protein